MGKGKSFPAPKAKAIDPSLDALFSHSAGPVKTPPKSRFTELLPQRSRAAPKEEEEVDDEVDDEELSEADEAEFPEDDAESDAEDEDEDMEDASSVGDEAEVVEVPETVSRKATEDEGRKRKRKQRNDDEDLETNYLERLVNDEEPTGKRRKADAEDADGTTKDAEDKAGKEGDDSSDDEMPVHESLKKTDSTPATELEKANRTVFLSNVAVDAITSSKSKKILLNHLASVLDKTADPPQKVESIRFRSTAFTSAAIPKRAAYIKKEVLDATTKSTNAYAVYSTTTAARLAITQLNGTMVLDRHIRVDSVAHPAPVDHRRCVFVGNLGFVDDETVYNTTLNAEGKEETTKRKRTKTPMDVEEGLWRVFGKEGGKVESVRVVRDAVTRVGKGFAYVQFYDGNGVESAILLNGKKFPPMLPRELRVTRCKAPHKTARAMEARQARAPLPTDRKGGSKHDGKNSRKGDTGKYVPKPTAEGQTLAGRASKLLGRFGAAKLSGKTQGRDRRERNRKWLNRDADGAKGGDGEATGEKAAFKKPEDFVFEGRRASAKDGRPKDLKFKGARSGKAGKKWRGKK
ncbi:hypothetical protein BT67DRAFT_398098 [Trichocladium antarcticum]|uniref:Nucleolar protein 12 n=1 Tax=Trichocladium antarcticum TaxID=1450529 RepID=A0AAN6ZF10_9PEZI|nr:hypothetical protein BT67DRAFT_398098 [Trichocladium antarcticum]